MKILAQQKKKQIFFQKELENYLEKKRKSFFLFRKQRDTAPKDPESLNLEQSAVSAKNNSVWDVQEMLFEVGYKFDEEFKSEFETPKIAKTCTGKDLSLGSFRTQGGVSGSQKLSPLPPLRKCCSSSYNLNFKRRVVWRIPKLDFFL